VKTTITLTIAFTLLAAPDTTVARVDTILAWLTAAWMFAFGTCVGSFLNVVIYRLPAGMSIVLPGSHCPKCKHAIRAYDNIPIVSWLVLRGRCRDCGATISPRYATIELLAGLALLGLYLADVAMGWGLPLESAAADVAGGASVATPTWLPWIALCYHALLLCTLLCAAAIEWDRNAVPTKLIAPALILGIAAPMALRALHPLAVSRDFDSWLTSRVPDGAAHVLASLATSFAGFALGALLGYVTSFSQRPDSTARIDRRAAVLLAGLVGLILGWQSAVVLASAASLAFLIIAILGRPFPRFRSIPWSAGLTILVALYMMNGRAFVELLDRPGSGASLLMLLAAIGVTLLCAVAARTVMSKR
jgi:prepilin signal peptidase PulO-like enzyme (type II secretory pathway)